MSYGVFRGDYGGGGYGSVGDPGLFGFLGRVAGGIAKTVGGFVPGPAGMVLRKAGGLLTRAPARPQITPRQPGMQQRFMPGAGTRPISGQITRTTAVSAQVPQIAGAIRPRRQRMNYGNVKALKRADRRISGFVKVAKSALTHTNYKVVSKTAGTAAKCVKCRRVRCIC